jgi:hypothetical protein
MAETPDRVVKASKKPRIAVFMGISPLSWREDPA